MKKAANSSSWPASLGRLSRADFSSLSTLKKEHGRLFTLLVSKSPDNKPRFTCVVSKKAARQAHQRFLVKRRCRAAVREIGPKEALAFVFLAKPAAAQASYREVLEEVGPLIVKATSGLN